jgi:hypothetical protein
MDERRRNELGEKLVWHSKGPVQTALEYNRYVVNGNLFRILSHDEGKTTQNSGVCVPTVDGETYYGKLTRIFEVEYYDMTRYVLFKCDWADITRDRGYKIDEYGITLVNFTNLVHTGERITDDPYVLSSQVSQCFYVEDERHPNWCSVLRIKPRNVYDVGEGEGHDACINYHETEPLNLNVNADIDDVIEITRNDIPPIEVDVGQQK